MTIYKIIDSNNYDFDNYVLLCVADTTFDIEDIITQHKEIEDITNELDLRGVEYYITYSENIIDVFVD